MDLGGPATRVTAESGFFIAAVSPNHARQTSRRRWISKADPALEAMMGETDRPADRRALTCEKKAEQLVGLSP